MVDISADVGLLLAMTLASFLELFDEHPCNSRISSTSAGDSGGTVWSSLPMLAGAVSFAPSPPPILI